MSVEYNAYEVVGLPLVLICGPPHVNNRLNVRIFFRAESLQNNLVLMRHGGEMVDRSELSIVVVDSAETTHIIEIQAFIIPQVLADVFCAVPSDLYPGLWNIQLAFDDCITELLF